MGGLTSVDIEKWSVWQDPEASIRNSTKEHIEETQGNGGKAYMCNLFNGPARILGIKNNVKNCKGFIGEPDSEERGTPGFMPNIVEGKNASVQSFWDELEIALNLYNLNFFDLPEDVKDALNEQCSFTLVEGIQPKRFENKIQVDDLLEKIKKNPQASIPLESLKIYVFHNGNLMNDGKTLTIDSLPPFPSFEKPRIYDIPEFLPENNKLTSTTAEGTKSKGKLILYTTKKDISKRFSYRWTINYKTKTEIVGSISIGEIIPPGIPASQFIYGEIELDALSPDYVNLGRDRPNEGPLLTVLNDYTSEKICELAEEINKIRKQKLDERILDEVHEENILLDNWKNKILTEISDGITGPSIGNSGGGEVPSKPNRNRQSNIVEWGEKPTKISIAKKKLAIGQGVKFHLSTILKPIARDYEDRPIPSVEFEWWSDNQKIANFSIFSDEIECFNKGICNIGIRIKGTDVYSKIPIEVWDIKHILQTPRRLDILLGTRQKIIAEVTNHQGERNTNILLNWKHSAKDQLTVRINPSGWITGNRQGKTVIYAGAGSTWAETGSEAEVKPNPKPPKQGHGFPQILLTERGIDPETGHVREGDIEKPALWQEVSDVKHNIWWINMQNPQSAFAFEIGGAFWRNYHSEKLTEMVVQALMQLEFTQKGDEEEPKHWGDHKFIMDEFSTTVVQAMWNKLEEYIDKGKEGLI